MENTQNPSQTVTPPAQSSNVSQPAVAPERSAAVSHALQQAIPPKPTGGVRTLPETPRQDSSTQTSSKSESNSDREYSLEDFDDDGNLRPQPTKPVAKETKPHDAQKTETVKEDIEEKALDKSTQKEDEEPKQEDKLELEINLDEELKNLNQTKENKGRDYSRFKPEHVELLKHVPNRVFDKLSQELLSVYNLEKENKDLKEKFDKSTLGKLPESYYEHENAYTLTPRYKELETEIRYDSYEENHWQEQLMRIKQGQDWMLLKGYSKDGVPQFERIQALRNEDGETQLDVRAEMTISQYLDQARNLKRQHTLEQQGLQQNHQKEYITSKQGIETLKQTFFKPLLDESKLSPVIKGDITKAKEAFAQTAPAFKNSPVAELLSLAYATMKLQQRQLLNMMRVLNSKKVEEIDAIEAGPSKEEFRGGSNQGGDKILSEKDFE